jgi:glutathione S-transferase
VLGVVDGHLRKQGTGYLVGNKATYADLAWVTWDALLQWLVPDLDLATEFPDFNAWHQRLVERPAVKKTFADKDKVNAA